MDLTGGTIRGNLTFNNQGASTITTSATSRVLGNASLSFGSNTNTYNLANNFVVGGSLSITAANGTNAITLGGGTGGAVGLNLTVNLGNGANNSFTIADG